VPSVYQSDGDLFVQPLPHPSADALSWDEPILNLNEEGEAVSGSERYSKLQ